MTEDSVRVIVVDDVSDAAQTLALLLELDAHHVAIAYDGAQALAMIDAFAPHCILFDIDMPVLDGFELSKQVRARHENDIVLIAATPPTTKRSWKRFGSRSARSVELGAPSTGQLGM